MKRLRMLQAGWLALLAVLLLALITGPVDASAGRRQASDATAINANIYLATNTLMPLFQDQVNQRVPGAFNSAIASIVAKMPAQDQGWAQQMANSLIQPSVALTGLKPQQGGLLTSLRVSLYPGDPQPLNANLLVSFKVNGATSVQVSAQPLNGSPTLVNGPLTNLSIPIGQLNSIAATPSCGSAALAVNLQYPISLNLAQSGQAGALADIQRPARRQFSNLSAYVEIPSASLAALGNSIGSLPISSSLTAKNIRDGTHGQNLVIVSDDYLGFLRLGVATTTMAPTAQNGNLAVNILKTTLTVFQFFTFPYNTYNQQIQQLLNSKLNGALAGKFTVTRAGVGGGSAVPCAAGDSLLLGGTTNLG